MFRPTLACMGKASRAPLNSKQANKNFYKGTRTGNIMKRKRIASVDRAGNRLLDHRGQEGRWTMMTDRIDELKVTSFIVPPGLADTQLKPYVQMKESNQIVKRTGEHNDGVPSPPPGYSAPMFNYYRSGRNLPKPPPTEEEMMAFEDEAAGLGISVDDLMSRQPHRRGVFSIADPTTYEAFGKEIWERRAIEELAARDIRRSEAEDDLPPPEQRVQQE